MFEKHNSGVKLSVESNFLGGFYIMKYNKLFLFIAVIFAFADLALAKKTESYKTGFVDFGAAIQGTRDGKKARKTLEAEFAKRKKELDKKEKDLSKQREELEKKSAGWNEKTRGQKQTQLNESFRIYQDLLSRAQEEIRSREKKLMSPIYEKMKKALGRVANQEGYSAIFEKNQAGVLWINVEDDLTDKLIKAYSSKK